MKVLEINEFIQGILDSIPFYVMLVDSDHNIVLVNKAIGLQFNVNTEQLIGKYCPNIIHCMDKPFPGCPLEEAVLKKSSITKELYDSKYDKWYDSSIFLTEYVTISGKQIYFHTVRDITEMKMLEKEKKITEEKLFQSQKIELIGQLTSGIAHDFNNILSGILSSVELVKRRTDSNSSINKYIEQILNSCNTAKNLIGQLSSFTRKASVEMKSCDLHLCIHRVVEILRQFIDNRIFIEEYCSAQDYFVKANCAQIDSMLLNIGINAKDAMPGGGVVVVNTKNVQLTEESLKKDNIVAVNGNYINITIKDSGKGISKEIIKHIFEPFYTTKEIGKGTGLGLSMVLGIIEQHHGYITVESDEGSGTTFSIFLPVL